MLIVAYLTIDRWAKLEVRKNPPRLNGDQIGMKLLLDVPNEVFNRPLPVLELQLPKEVVMNPDASLVAQLSAQTIAGTLQLEVKEVTDGLLQMLKAKTQKENDEPIEQKS